jgi:hypothetical protein
MLVGWPVGWAVACVGAVERGETVVLQSLGENPATTVRRFARHGLLMALALAGSSLVCGTDATAPGRVATELVARAHSACSDWAAAARPARTYAIPFTEWTWLCAPGHDPLLAGPVPGSVARSAFLVATNASIGGDFRTLQLEGARVSLGAGVPISMRVDHVSIRGMTPWAHTSNLPAGLRAIVLALSAWATGSIAAHATLTRLVRSRAAAMGLGALGPLVALALLRIFERADAPVVAFASLPMVACAAELAVLMVGERLRAAWPTATSQISAWGRHGLRRGGRRHG